ncbi:MAG: alpha/beta fold hydrolase [Tepidiformaceae bacterium]
MKWYVAFVTGVGAAVGLVVGATMLLARLMRVGALDVDPDHGPDPCDLEVVKIADGRITLRPAARRPRNSAAEPGIWGIQNPAGGYDRIGSVIEQHGRDVVREFEPVQNAMHAGDRIRLDTFAQTGDPFVAHGLAFEEVSVPSALGVFPAWFVPADGGDGTWAILVHGKGANRREGLRIMPALHAAGIPVLAITYRNDIECPRDPDGYYGYGRTEWEDLECAAQFALDHGARQLLMVGFSMGGAITMSFMARSPLAPRVAGLILDAPMLNLEDTIAHGAAQMRVPRRFLSLSNRVVTHRYDVQWHELDYATETSHIVAPILLFHGDADRVIPVALSDTFAQTVGGQVSYVRVPSAGHVRAWNLNPEAYEAAVRAFVDRVIESERSGAEATPAGEETRSTI